MWKLCLASLIAASASALRKRGIVDTERPGLWPRWKWPFRHNHTHPKETPDFECANATEKATETQSATCGPFPGKQVVLVTVSTDFMPFFQNWLHYAGPFLTSSEQVVAFAEDKQVVPMLRRFLHEGARTPFKIAIPANETQISWNVIAAAADRSYSQDVYKIRIQDIHPFNSKAYNEIVSQRPRQIMHFLEQGCSVLYSDIDMAWLQNPFDAISRAGDYEMYVTDDRDKKPASLTSTYLCSCFLYMHPTSNVKAVISLWESMLKGKTDYDQPFFNKAFQKIRHRSPGFAVALPRKEFPPGCDVPDHPTVLHANWIAGEQNKIKFLKEHGAWSLH
mmetsp:Transcript_152070/g.369312  ORF Transcript_152070/g.369312 Transcript_152070/m.369312 type:complete len:335 (-) Transcript_152070:171-1175(-)